jgi:hypothetical protein
VAHGVFNYMKIFNILRVAAVLVITFAGLLGFSGLGTQNGEVSAAGDYLSSIEGLSSNPAVSLAEDATATPSPTLATPIYLPLIIVNNPPTFTPTPTITPTPTPDSGLPPPYSTSYYMRTINTTTMSDLGCALGTADQNSPGVQDSIVVLDFGMPREWDGNYGASLFGFGPATVDELEFAIETVGYWYYLCSPEDTGSHLRIGVGTSNYGSQVTNSHGVAWAQMVNSINAYFISAGLYYRFDAVGMNDMEIDWNSPGITRAWVDGYDSVNLYPLISFGDAAGCPTYDYPHWTCGNGWSQEDVWYISYGVGSSYPLPLIYADSGVNAEQWHLLSLYSYEEHGHAMEIQGTMTQYQTCQQVGGCGTLDNTPAEGWTYLWTYLNSDPRTAQGLRYSTDIMWYE